MATSAPLSPLRPSWDCICAIGRHAWCPQHGYERPQPTEPLFSLDVEIGKEARAENPETWEDTTDIVERPERVDLEVTHDRAD